MRKILLLTMPWWMLIANASAATDLHQPFDALLKQHVVTISPHSTAVDYVELAKDKKRLYAYLSALAAVDKDRYAQWSSRAQLAFLINAYNAHTLALIVKHYEKIDSIRDIGGFFSSAWDQPVAFLLGKKRTLDEIEHGIIRGQLKGFDGFDEPRIHFAVNCASIGCPALREEAYREAKLEQQLEDQTRRFLADTSRNRMTGDELQISKIFDWYKADFTANDQSLTDFFRQYSDVMQLSESQQIRLQNHTIEIEFLDYDWSLNATR